VQKWNELAEMLFWELTPVYPRNRMLNGESYRTNLFASARSGKSEGQVGDAAFCLITLESCS